jgi:hypothetical protein
MHACSSVMADCPGGRGTMRAIASGHAQGRLCSRSVPISSVHRSLSVALFHVLFDGFAASDKLDWQVKNLGTQSCYLSFCHTAAPFVPC